MSISSFGNVYYRAREMAFNNNRSYHLAAILRRNGRVIKIGENTNKTHPKFTRVYDDGTIASHMHAEMNVLRFAEPGDELEVMRFLKTGPGFAMAKPCDHCMGYIRSAGIKKIRYTNKCGEWEQMVI